MKTIGRILIILLVFSLVMGMTYTIVNAGSSNSATTGPAFGRGDGERPEFPGGVRDDGRGFGFGSGLRMILGGIKNSVIIGVIVALVVIPKNRLRKKKRDAQEVTA